MQLRGISARIFSTQSLLRSTLAVLVLGIAHVASVEATQPVLQRGYDKGVSGASLTETTLNTTNVGPATFGLIFKLPVDDYIFAQPLYVPNVAIPNQGTHNVVYVATMSDTLYAFDADAVGAPLWKVNFANGSTPPWMANFAFSNNKNIVGNLGILSTPVIDATTHILYLIACTLENNTLAYRLHAVDITNGSEPYGPGVLITGTYGTSTFDARYLTQRVSLTLSGNHVVFAFGAVELEYAGGYVGWVMAYNKRTLAQTLAFATVLSGNRGGGVWQSGRPPVIDSSGFAYVFTGNGYGNGYNPTDQNYSESVLKLDPANPKTGPLVDWFTPDNWSTLDSQDKDLSSSGPLLIPGTTLLAGGGKSCELYVLQTTGLGHFTSTDALVAQEEQICASLTSSPSSIRGGPVYWQRSGANGGPLLYNWGANDAAKAYAFNGTQFGSSPVTQSSAAQIWPGGILTLSANGGQHGSGVLWATVATSGDALNNPPVPGALLAFNAEDLTQELWNSTTDSSRDDFGLFAKFAPPVVANGKVYVATWSNQVAVYGLLSTYTLAPASLAFGTHILKNASAAMTTTVTNTGELSLPITNITLTGINPGQFQQTHSCGTSLAVGASCTISVIFKPTTAGSKTAKLNVIAGGGAGTKSVVLTGTGAAALYSVAPTSLAFGSVPHGTKSPSQPVTITNTGTAPLSITSITFAGSNPAMFPQTNSCGSPVAVGGTCSISVAFKPGSTGAKSAKLNINAGDGAGTQTVALGGTGT